MRKRRSSKLLVEPPTSATGDIAFNLIVFFLVCASVQPDRGRSQQIPKAEETEQEQQAENIEVDLRRNDSVVLLNGDAVPIAQFPTRLRALLAGKQSESDRVVIVKSKPDVTYQHWIFVTTIIDDLGGIVTLQLEEEREVRLPE